MINFCKNANFKKVHLKLNSSTQYPQERIPFTYYHISQICHQTFHEMETLSIPDVVYSVLVTNCAWNYCKLLHTNKYCINSSDLVPPCVAGMQNLSISCALVCLIILGSSALVGAFGVLKHQISAVLVTGVMYLLAGETCITYLIMCKEKYCFTDRLVA